MDRLGHREGDDIQRQHLKQPQDLEKYWGQFQDRQRDVQGILTRLVTQTTSDPTLSRRIETLRQEHLQLGVAYQ